MKRMRTRNFKTVGACIVLVFLASGAHAATFTVDRTGDNPAYSTCSPAVDHDCSLRGAITAANELVGHDTIEFDLQPNPPFFVGILFLAVPGDDEDGNLTGDLDIRDSLTIDGGGWITIDATSVNDRVLDIRADTVFLHDITISGGNVSTNGGGIYGGSNTAHDLNLTLERVTVKNNYANAYGGGLVINGSTATIIDSLLTGNFTGGGQSTAILVSESDVELVNSTISGNGSLETPGSPLIIWVNSWMLFSYSTITDNLLRPSDNHAAEISDSAVTFLSSIIEGECGLSGSPSLVTMGGSIESPGDTCQLQPAIDQIAVPDLALLPLADYGGPTLSHLPLAVSPAVDDPLQSMYACSGSDQRGMPRDVDGDGDGFAGCDAGAVELQPGGPYILVDGFESGGLWRWSSVSAQ